MTISTMQPRLSTGISGCDEIFGGGLVPHRSNLMAGSPESGKTIFLLQWLRNGLARGERCMYIALCEPTAEIGRNAANFGWNLLYVEVVDLSLVTRAPYEGVNEYYMFPTSEVEGAPFWKAIFSAAQNSKQQRLVIDSVTQLHYLASDEYQFRRNILGLVNLLNGAGCTSIFALVPSEMERDITVALAIDGVIRLASRISAGLGIGIRSIQVDKLRGSDFMSGAIRCSSRRTASAFSRIASNIPAQCSRANA
jgi:circadian clock protein KaiC